MGTLTYKGNVSVGVAFPLFPVLAASVTATLPPLLVDIQAKVSALLVAVAAFNVAPPSLLLDASAAITAFGAITGSLSLILPMVDFTVSFSLGIIAKLKIQIAAIQLARTVTANFVGPSASASVIVAVYQGPLQTFGASLAASLQGSVTGPLYLPIFVVHADNGTTTQSFGKVMKTS